MYAWKDDIVLSDIDGAVQGVGRLCDEVGDRGGHGPSKGLIYDVTINDAPSVPCGARSIALV